MSAIQYGCDPFWVKFQSCRRQPLSWKEEVYAAARKIAENTRKPIWVCMSGGIDSELVAQAMIDQDIPFSVLTIAHKEGTNEHDIRYARKWCADHGIRPKVVETDMQRLLTEDMSAYIRQGYVSSQAFRYFQLRLFEMVEELGGYAVLGGGEQLFLCEKGMPTGSIDDVYLGFDVGYAAPLEWCRRQNTSHQPYFYFSTPELCLSYLKMPVVSACLSNPEVFRHPLNCYFLKILAYQGAWPRLRTRQKYTGYENVWDLDKQACERLRAEFGERIQLCRIPVRDFERQLAPTVR